MVNKKTLQILLVIALIAIAWALGYGTKKSDCKKLQAEIEQLEESNNFKRTLIRAYENYVDTDEGYEVIDSLYRSQL